jgi:RHS repeat-associated protein
VRHLFTGQQWYSQIGLYDLRNRFYSPDIGRFLQPDPIGFWGGNNLYRYCRNNPVTKWDPFGLTVDPTDEEQGNNGFDVSYGGEEAFPGRNGTDSNYGYEPNPGSTGQGDSVTVSAGPLESDYGGSPGGVPGGVPGGSLGGIPGGIFFGTNAGSGGMPSEGGGPRGFGTDRGPNGNPGGVPSNPLSQPLGSIFIYGSNSLLGQRVHYNNLHRAQAQSMIQFANGLDIGATIFVGGTLGPAAIYAGGMIVVDAGALGLEAVYHGGWYAAGAATAAYQTAIRYPGAISNVEQAIDAFISPGFQVPTNTPQAIGTGANYFAGQYDPTTFGP